MHVTVLAQIRKYNYIFIIFVMERRLLLVSMMKYGDQTHLPALHNSKIG